jgi:hypothetical protein
MIERIEAMRMPEAPDRYWEGWNDAVTQAKVAVREALAEAPTVTVMEHARFIGQPFIGRYEFYADKSRFSDGDRVRLLKETP